MGSFWWYDGVRDEGEAESQVSSVHPRILDA